MAKVMVAAVMESHPEAARIQENLSEAQAAVEEHAYHVAARGRNEEFENWMRAERELFWIPPCELIEQNGDLRLRVAVPGLEAKQIKLTALSASIVIEAGANGKMDSRKSKTHFSEFNSNIVLRRVDLPMPIDAEAVQAKLERGILEIVAPKAGQGGKVLKAAPAAASKKRASSRKAITPRKSAAPRRKKSV